MEEEIARLRTLVAVQARRLDYAFIQLEREAKFLPKNKPENRRFYRALNVVEEVRDTLSNEAR